MRRPGRWTTSHRAAWPTTPTASLPNAMEAGGLSVYSGEWWHIDGPGAKDPRPILDVPVN
jgi:D-alanyl-D-alanine dipeptidase